MGFWIEILKKSWNSYGKRFQKYKKTMIYDIGNPGPELG
jgi:hypothetical protein